MSDDFGAWLAAQVCDGCGAHATHRVIPPGKKFCNACTAKACTEDTRAQAFALND